MSDSEVYDLFVVGGGINGTGIAADAAGRGWRVALAEMADLASATSSASSKLIHGGLRYLEYYEFRLVREALAEREVLLRKAPHLIWPLRFVLPHVPGVRPAWMVRAGLFLYDHLHSREQIPASRSLDLAADPAGQPLKPEFNRGFTYWDCWVDDARLVVLNAKAARQRGARVMTRTRVTALMPIGDQWQIEIDDGQSKRLIRARALVNAAGPWVDGVDKLMQPGGRGLDNARHVRLIKGSHLVVRRIAGADDAYLMQNRDKRVVFVLPFEEHFTIIGTTDVAYEGDPAAVAASAEEEKYLLDLAAQFFKQRLTPADVVWRYAGVRPLYDDASADPSAVTRDYHLTLAAAPGRPPCVSVYGGKVTTYRRLAEEALALLGPQLGGAVRPPWTATAPLPGGDVPGGSFDDSVADMQRRYPSFDPLQLKRMTRRHGTLVGEIIGDARSPADMGQAFGAGLTEREVGYMKSAEWATQPDDILWRRSKLGLHALASASTDDQHRLAEKIAKLL